MSVYVDDMRAPYGRLIMCHMVSDDPTHAELHDMADKIGVARKWFQGDHYDICLSKRAKAVQFGAVECTMEDASRITVPRRLDARADAWEAKGDHEMAAKCREHAREIRERE